MTYLLTYDPWTEIDSTGLRKSSRTRERGILISPRRDKPLTPDYLVTSSLPIPFGVGV